MLHRAHILILCAALVIAGCSAGAPDRDATPRVDRSSPTSSRGEVPGEGDPARFAVIGDFGSGSPDQYAIGRRMCSWRRTEAFEFVVTTGDNVYPDGDPALFDAEFLRPFDCLFDAGVDFHASLGNHDVMTDGGQPEIDEPAFGMAAPNYVVRRDGVRLVIADSNDLDVAWLREALPEEPGDRWTVVVFHHPVYSPGAMHGSTPGFDELLPEVFEASGVDLVLNGHDHLYSVSKPLDAIRYVVTGGGGSIRLDACTEQAFTDRCESRYHFLSVVAGRDEIVVEAVPASGPPFDRFRTKGS